MLLEEIRRLECSLHGVKRSDAKWLDAVLHPDFREITRSGVIVDRQTTLSALRAEHGSPGIAAGDFYLQVVSEECVILTYRTWMPDQPDNPRCARRASCWKRTAEKGWQLMFHQGTPDPHSPAC